MVLMLENIDKNQKPSIIVSPKKNGEMWMLRIKSLDPRGFDCEVTMGKSCGGVLWQIEHGPL